MSKGETKFERWKAHEGSTWSLQVFSRYDDELGIIHTAHLGALRYTYKNLGRQGAIWTDSAAATLDVGDRFLDHFSDLKHWSNEYCMFDNWVNLNTVLTIAANLETYMSAVVKLSLESDPGVLLGESRSVDGAILLKRKSSKVLTEPHVIACTKGTWSSRMAALKGLFGPLPQSIAKHEGDLEKIRLTRNRIGHAFGRDIEQVKDHGLRQTQPIEAISRDKVFRLKAKAFRFAKAVDEHLLQKHIGEYEAVRYFARAQQDILYARNRSRAEALKKFIGRIGAVPRGKSYCEGLIDYWDRL